MSTHHDIIATAIEKEAQNEESATLHHLATNAVYTAAARAGIREEDMVQFAVDQQRPEARKLDAATTEKIRAFNNDDMDMIPFVPEEVRRAILAIREKFTDEDAAIIVEMAKVIQENQRNTPDPEDAIDMALTDAIGITALYALDKPQHLEELREEYQRLYPDAPERRITGGPARGGGVGIG